MVAILPLCLTIAIVGNTDSTLLRVVRTKDMSSGFSDRAFVPMTDAEIFQWLRLVSNVCLDRGFLNYPFRVVYSDSLPSQFPSRVEIRVQGILESGALLSSVFVSYVLTSRFIFSRRLIFNV